MKNIHRYFTLGALALGMSAQSFGQITLYSAWDLNEGSGTTTNQATLGAGESWTQVTNPNQTFPGTATDSFSGLATWGAAGTAPGSTASLTFNGTAGENGFDTNVSGTGLNGTGAKTFIAWINPTAGNGSILSYSPSHGTGQGGDLRLVIDPSGYLRAEVSSGFFLYENKNFINDGWNMVAVIYDTDTATSRFYLGGTGVLSPTSNDANDRAINTGSQSSSGDPLESDNFIIGTDPASRGFTGGLDMIAVYTGAATESELNSIYANGIAAIPEPGTLALVGVALGALLVFRRRAS